MPSLPEHATLKYRYFSLLQRDVAWADYEATLRCLAYANISRALLSLTARFIKHNKGRSPLML